MSRQLGPVALIRRAELLSRVILMRHMNSMAVLGE